MASKCTVAVGFSSYRAAVQRTQHGTVTLIEMCSGAVSFRAVAMDQLWVVEISGGSIYRVERGNLTPGREAFSHLGSPLGCAEPVPSRPKVSGDAAKGHCHVN